jgi:hypothetical protein
MKKSKIPKPRNPFVQHLVTKKQGAHTKRYKTHRRDAKVSLKKQTDYSHKLYEVFVSSLNFAPVAQRKSKGLLSPRSRYRNSPGTPNL